MTSEEIAKLRDIAKIASKRYEIKISDEHTILTPNYPELPALVDKTIAEFENLTKTINHNLQEYAYCVEVNGRALLNVVEQRLAMKEALEKIVSLPYSDDDDTHRIAREALDKVSQ